MRLAAGKDLAVVIPRSKADKSSESEEDNHSDSSEESEEYNQRKSRQSDEEDGQRKNIIVDGKILQYLHENSSSSNVRSYIEEVPLYGVERKRKKSSPKFLHTSSYLLIFLSTCCFFVFMVMIHTFIRNKEIRPRYEV